MNASFFNEAFAWDERQKLLKCNNDNGPASGCIVSSDEQVKYYGAETEDKVYIPSFFEVINRVYGFDGNPKSSDPRRIAEVTDYAIARGVQTHIGPDGQMAGWWWLRSPANYADYYATHSKGSSLLDNPELERRAKVNDQLRVCDVMDDGHVCTRGSIIDGATSFVSGAGGTCNGTTNGIRPFIRIGRKLADKRRTNRISPLLR